MKYKALETYKNAKNKHFQLGVQKVLLRGGYIELTEEAFNALPVEVSEHLEAEKTKTKVSKKDTKKEKGDK